jgi:hypothetical protein
VVIVPLGKSRSLTLDNPPRSRLLVVPVRASAGQTLEPDLSFDQLIERCRAIGCSVGSVWVTVADRG